MFYPSFNRMRPDPFAMLRQMMSAPAVAQRTAFPPVNLWLGPDAIALSVEVPGADPEDIEITVEDSTLTISGEIRPEEFGEDAIWHRNERRYGKFSRTIQLPFRVDPDKVEARFVNGVLQIALQRPDADKPKRIEVKAG